MAVPLQVQRGYVTATVAASILGVSRQRVNQLLNANKLPGSFLVDCGDGHELWCIPRSAINKRKEKMNGSSTTSKERRADQARHPANR